MDANAMAARTFQEPAAGLPWSEKLSLVVYLAFLVVPKAVVNATRSFFIALRHGWDSRMYMTSAVIGAALGNLTPAQLQYISDTSIHVYRSWMKQMVSKARARGETDHLPSLETEIQLLPDGQSSIFWLGNRKAASKYILFFHGGGYVAPLLPGHLEWCWRMFVSQHINTRNEVAVAVLDYTLCPAAQFPTQLCQSVAAMESLLSAGIRPDQIIIGGDSAGGNLTAHLLRHIAHPDPHAPPLSISKPLLGAFLVSPWLSPDTSQKSMVENSRIDMLTAHHINDASRSFYGAGICKTDLLNGETTAFDDVASVVGDVYVTAGQQEVLRDQAVVFVDRLRRRNKNLKIRFEIAEEEAHDFILLEGQEQRTGSAMERMKAWAMELIQGP